MKAKSIDTCSICHRPIEIGEEIGWVRRGVSAGNKYHSACFCDAVLESPSVTAPVEVSEFRTAKTSPVNPELSKLTKTSKWWNVLAHALQHLTRVILIGPPGTGKSTTAINTCGIQYRVTMTESTTREDLIGMFHLINGDTKWVDGPVVQAMRNGEPVLIDEIDRYSQEVASMLYSILDDKPHVALPTGEIVSAKDGYKVVMTSNELPDMLPAAIFDRIEGIFEAHEPHEDAIRHLTDVNRQVVLNYYRSQTPATVKTTPTVRRMRAFHTLNENGMEDFASKIVFSGSAREIESAIASVKFSMGDK
jgi:hypothetical protein